MKTTFSFRFYSIFEKVNVQALEEWFLAFTSVNLYCYFFIHSINIIDRK